MCLLSHVDVFGDLQLSVNNKSALPFFTARGEAIMWHLSLRFRSLCSVLVCFVHLVKILPRIHEQTQQDNFCLLFVTWLFSDLSAFPLSVIGNTVSTHENNLWRPHVRDARILLGPWRRHTAIFKSSPEFLCKRKSSWCLYFLDEWHLLKY